MPTVLALFVLSLSVYLLTLPADLRNNADTVDRFFVTQNIVRHHTVQLGCSRASPGDSRLVRGRHGCWYAIYAPGQTVLMIPLYAVGKALSVATGLAHDFAIAIAVRSLDALLGALALVFFYLLALEIGYRRRTAILLTLLLTFGSTLWPDVQSGQEQTQVTLAIVAAAFASMKVRRTAAGRNRDLWVLTVGAAAGFGVFTRYDFVLYAGVLFGFGLWQLRSASTAPAGGVPPQPAEPRSTESIWPREQPRKKHTGARRTADLLRGVAIFGIGFVPFLVADALWNTLRFGEPWKVGQALSAQFGFPIWQGIPNLLVSPGKGLIWYLPLLWLLPFAFGSFRRRGPDLVWLGVTLFLVALVFYANLMYWHGDPAFGPRYLFPVVPIVLLPLGDLLERFATFRSGKRGLVLLVIALSVAVQLAAVSVDPWRFWHHLIDQRAQAGQVFQWNPRQYNYFWPGDADLIPELYQFVAVKDVAQVGVGDKNPFIPFPSTSERGLSSRGCPLPKPQAYDRCQAWGVALRPLNSVDSVWLSDRIQWTAPMPVPLSLLARVVILCLLGLAIAVSAVTLHLQFWRPDRA